ncbi:unnamed protein product [Caenorhabditis auriculariae]|uniref:Uncharacterized protein n=1 Tax=Caenorhabditis auriculariae TaxID=2777116 RepID=A0A8S1HRH4_9PELO|nr:unnamed protein product [Caenorhabditis auriculariae]
MARNRIRYRRSDQITWREKWTVFKHNRRKPGWVELVLYGLFLNIFGAALLFMKAQMDKDVIEAAIEKRFLEAGIDMNRTEGASYEPFIEPSSAIMVLITMLGRMANVVGTMKMYKGLGKFLSDRKRKKFRTTTERIQNGEAEAECTELFADCCQF